MADFRTLKPGQIARIHVHDAVTGEDTVVHESSTVLFEAPNWAPSGESLILNGDGQLWQLALDQGSEPTSIEYDGLPPVNNDHVLDPDGEHIFLSAMDKHIYRAALTGGTVTRVTSEEGIWHFLHGVSPDGERLAYVRIVVFGEPSRLGILPSGGGETTIIDTGAGYIDGPEWSPDGSTIYVNTERWATVPGHAQLASIPDGGGEVTRLVSSETVDWFPHISPDGASAVYLEFPTGTEGHPADHDVAIVVVDVADWTTPRERFRLPGGQGTINVNSWAPDSRRFAYVSYPFTSGS